LPEYVPASLLQGLFVLSAKLFVPLGAYFHMSAGGVFAPSQVYSRGIPVIGLKTELVSCRAFAGTELAKIKNRMRLVFITIWYLGKFSQNNSFSWGLESAE